MHGKTHINSVWLHFRNRKLYDFFSELKRKQLVGKTFKVIMPKDFVLQIATQFIFK